MPWVVTALSYETVWDISPLFPDVKLWSSQLFVGSQFAMSVPGLRLLLFALVLALVPVVGWCASSMNRNSTLWLLLAIFLSPVLAALGLVVVGGRGDAG